MKINKPLALIILDWSFMTAALLSFILHFIDMSDINIIGAIVSSAFVFALSTAIWYFSSRRGGAIVKFLFFSFCAMKIYGSIEMIRIFWFDNIRVAVNSVIIILSIFSIMSILHPSIRTWRERQKRGDVIVFE